MSQLVIINKADGVLEMTLNRPQKKNALNIEMYEMLNHGLIDASQDPGVRVVLFNANGDAFTSGNDLKDFAAANQGAVELSELPSIRFIELMLGFPKPVVAAVTGLAIGIGTTMLLHCDVVVAGRSSTFALPFTKLGLVPEFGSSYLLPALAGRVRASQALLLGEPFGIDDARDMGIVSCVCNDKDVKAEAREKCRRIATLPPKTLQDVKRLINSAVNPERLRQAIDTELHLFQQALKSEEHKQALSAFFDKKK